MLVTLDQLVTQINGPGMGQFKVGGGTGHIEKSVDRRRVSYQECKKGESFIER